MQMLIILSGLQYISEELYEAAEIDGCTTFQKFIYITVPGLKNTLVYILVSVIINSLKVFTQVYVLTNGGPGDATQFAANYLYQQAFKAFKYGYGNAIGVVFIIICILVTVGLNRIFAGREND